jgi:hypothetical protein
MIGQGSSSSNKTICLLGLFVLGLALMSSLIFTSNDIEISVQVYNAVPITTDGGDGNNIGGSLVPSFQIMILAIFGFIAFVGVLGIAVRARRSSVKSLSDKGELGASLSTYEPSSHIKEREVVSERFLVIFSFCGTNNEQGKTQCHNCGTKL